MKVEFLDEDNIADLVNIENQCFSRPWSEKSLRESIKSNKYIFLGVKADNKIVAYFGMNIILNEAYITNIATLDSYRNKGFGQAIIEKAIEYCKENECSFITLEVRRSNFSAISLYEKCNFKKVGIRKKFYNEPCEDAIIMTINF